MISLFMAFSFSEKIFISSLLGSKSHFKYLVQIGQELQHRGHTIEFISYSHNVDYVKDNLNITTKIITPNNQLLDESNSNWSKIESESQLYHFLGSWILHDYSKTYKQLAMIFQSEKPDMVICDFFAVSCSDVAKKLNIPLIIGIQNIDSGCNHYTK